MVVANWHSYAYRLYMYYLFTSVGLHISSCIYKIYYVIKYCINSPSKYIIVVIDNIFVAAKGQNMEHHWSAKNCDMSVKKCG